MIGKRTNKSYAKEIVNKTSETGWTYIRHVVDTAREPFLILNDKLRVLAANESFYQIFETVDKETENKFIYDLGNGQWAGKQLRKLLEDILPHRTFFRDFEVDHKFPIVGRKIILLNARRVYGDVEGFPALIILAMEDMTKQRMIEEKLKQYTVELEKTVESKTLDLIRRIDQLEMMNRVMIDREVKMSELKKEIRELKDRMKSLE